MVTLAGEVLYSWAPDRSPERNRKPRTVFGHHLLHCGRDVKGGSELERHTFVFVGMYMYVRCRCSMYMYVYACKQGKSNGLCIENKLMVGKNMLPHIQ